MSETNEQLEETGSWLDGKSILTIVLATLLGQIIKGNIDWLPYPVGLVLAYLVVLLVGYWFGRRPPQSFGRFALNLVGQLLLVVAGLWAVPELLSKLIWRPLAFGASILVFGILFYWMPPLLTSVGQKKRPTLWAWVIWVVIFAVIWGYIGSKSLE